MTATDELRRMLDERGVDWNDGGEGLTIIPVQYGVPRAWEVNTWPSGKDMGDCLWVQNRHPLTPEQAIAATVGSDRLAFLEEKVKQQGDYIDKLTKEKKALFAQNCEAATRHSGQMDYMQRKLEAATVSPKTAKRVMTTNPETDGATGRCHCGACNKSIDPSDNFCRRCGVRLEDK